MQPFYSASFGLSSSVPVGAAGSFLISGWRLIQASYRWLFDPDHEKQGSSGNKIFFLEFIVTGKYRNFYSMTSLFVFVKIRRSFFQQWVWHFSPVITLQNNNFLLNRCIKSSKHATSVHPLRVSGTSQLLGKQSALFSHTAPETVLFPSSSRPQEQDVHTEFLPLIQTKQTSSNTQTHVCWIVPTPDKNNPKTFNSVTAVSFLHAEPACLSLMSTQLCVSKTP